MKNIPANYPNPYFHDGFDHKFPSVTFIRYAVTPSGRRGIDFEQVRFTFKPEGENIKQTNEQIIARAEMNTTPNRLRKGYVWGELFVHHDFSGRNFINE